MIIEKQDLTKKQHIFKDQAISYLQQTHKKIPLVSLEFFDRIFPNFMWIDSESCWKELEKFKVFCFNWEKKSQKSKAVASPGTNWWLWLKNILRFEERSIIFRSNFSKNCLFIWKLIFENWIEGNNNKKKFWNQKLIIK